MIKFPALASGLLANGSHVMKHGLNRQMYGHAYLSRSSYLLQQGKFVADIVYYYGEDNNITTFVWKKITCYT